MSENFSRKLKFQELLFWFAKKVSQDFDRLIPFFISMGINLVDGFIIP